MWRKISNLKLKEPREYKEPAKGHPTVVVLWRSTKAGRAATRTEEWMPMEQGQEWCVEMQIGSGQRDPVTCPMTGMV